MEKKREKDPRLVAFGKRVRAARDAADLTQAQVTGRLKAAGVRVPSTAVAKIETGTRPTTVVELEALADALGASPSKLLARDGTDAYSPALRAWNDAADARTDLLASMRRYEDRRAAALAARSAHPAAIWMDEALLEDLELLVAEYRHGAIDKDGNPVMTLHGSPDTARERREGSKE